MTTETPVISNLHIPVLEEAEDKRGYDAFVSYSHKDKEWVRSELVPHLEEAGLSVAIDYLLMEDSGNLNNLRLGLENSRVLVPVWSWNYFHSKLAPEELDFAIQQSRIGKMAVIPVLVGDRKDIPEQYGGIDFLDMSSASAWAKLIDSIRDEIKKQQDAVEPVKPGPLPEEKIEVRGRALDDIYSQQDLLGYQDYVHALADFIESPKTGKPITIGIDAPWGGGKTTIMRMLQARLDPSVVEGRAKREKASCFTVWFNAWKYNQQESLWAALVMEVLEEARRQVGFRQMLGLSFQLYRRRVQVGGFLRDFLKSFLIVVLIFLAGLSIAWAVAFASKDTLRDVLTLSYWIDTVRLAQPIGLLTVVSLAYTVFKDVMGRAVSPFSLGISRYFKQPDYDSQISFLSQFQDDFNLVIESVTQKGKWPLVVFIDDLDRCTPDQAVSVIEAMNLLLDSKYCVFILGMDAHVLASSIQAKYKDLQEFFRDPDNPGGLNLGHKFLEKIVQIDFRIPSPSPVLLESFIDTHLGRKTANTVPAPSPVDEPQRLIQAEQRTGKSLEDAAQVVGQNHPDLSSKVIQEAARQIKVRSFDDNDEVRQTVKEAVSYLDYNPRKIKRYINLYRLQALVAHRRHVLEKSVSLDILGKWILISLRWPEFFDECIEHHGLPASFVASASKLNAASGMEQRKDILENLTGSSLRQDRIRLLLDNQDLFRLLSALPLEEKYVDSYLQIVQLDKPEAAQELAQV